jgi:hypothetical protein
MDNDEEEDNKNTTIESSFEEVDVSEANIPSITQQQQQHGKVGEIGEEEENNGKKDEEMENVDDEDIVHVQEKDLLQDDDAHVEELEQPLENLQMEQNAKEVYDLTQDDDEEENENNKKNEIPSDEVNLAQEENEENVMNQPKQEESIFVDDDEMEEVNKKEEEEQRLEPLIEEVPKQEEDQQQEAPKQEEEQRLEPLIEGVPKQEEEQQEEAPKQEEEQQESLKEEEQFNQDEMAAPKEDYAELKEEAEPKDETQIQSEKVEEIPMEEAQFGETPAMEEDKQAEVMEGGADKQLNSSDLSTPQRVFRQVTSLSSSEEGAESAQEQETAESVTGEKKHVDSLKRKFESPSSEGAASYSKTPDDTKHITTSVKEMTAKFSATGEPSSPEKTPSKSSDTGVINTSVKELMGVFSKSPASSPGKSPTANASGTASPTISKVKEMTAVFSPKTPEGEGAEAEKKKTGSGSKTREKVTVDPEGVKEFDGVKTNQTYKYLIYGIEGSAIKVLEKGDKDASSKEFLSKIQEDECRFCVLHHVFSKVDQYGKRQGAKLLFISWVPVGASVQQKMLYSSERSNLSSLLPGVSEISCGSKDELYAYLGVSENDEESATAMDE